MEEEVMSMCIHDSTSHVNRLWGLFVKSLFLFVLVIMSFGCEPEKPEQVARRLTEVEQSQLDIAAEFLKKVLGYAEDNYSILKNSKKIWVYKEAPPDEISRVQWYPGLKKILGANLDDVSYLAFSPVCFSKYSEKSQVIRQREFITFSGCFLS